MVASTASFSIGAVLLAVAVAASPYCHRWPWYYPWASPSRLSNVLGLVAGCILLIVYRLLLQTSVPENMLNFNQGLFFDVLLPFVIFNAGFCFKRVMFFANMGLILSYGLVGTVLSFLIISVGVACAFKLFDFKEVYDDGPNLRDILTLGATFCATDSVAILGLLSQEDYPLVFSLAFGEGVVNDAVAVVLAGAVSELGTEGVGADTVLFLAGAVIYLFVFSLGIGLVFGFATAFLVRRLFTIPRQQSPAYEVGLMLVMAFMSYYVSTLCGLSGILTIFICGIIDSHYTWYNLNDLAKISSRQFAQMMSNLCELYMFILVGMDSMDPTMWKEAHVDHVVALTGILLLLVVVSRALVIYPLTWVTNGVRIRLMSVSPNTQHIMVFGGVLRGSVTMAIAYKELKDDGTDQNKETFDVSDYDDHPGNERHGLHATLLAAAVVTTQITIIIMGMFTKPMLDHFLEDDDAQKRMYQFMPAHERPDIMDGGDSTDPTYNSPVVNTLDLQQSQPLIGGQVMDPHGDTHDRECCCITLKRYREFGAALRKYDRSVVQPLFGGQYAATPGGVNASDLDEMDQDLDGL